MKHHPLYYLRHYHYVVCERLAQLFPNSLFADKWEIEKQWKLYMDYPLNLDDPKTFCEKLQWIKLYDRNPVYHKLVDKYLVKEWVAEKIGAEHVVKLLKVYNTVDDIRLEELPNQFVLKCNHDSGGMAICKDKRTFDLDAAKVKLRQAMQKSHFEYAREWAYKDVKPVIIAEEFIDTLGKQSSVEYKITCSNGKVKMITICSGTSAHGDATEWFNDHFDRDGNRLPFAVNIGAVKREQRGIELPEKPILDELIRIAETLSVGIPHVRVDLYVHNGVVMFGEMSFYTWAGYMNIQPREFDRIVGDMIELPSKA